jgi:GST-like protein
MIDLYYWTTPNGHKITIFLEEAGLPYRITPVNISKGDQFKPEFLAISPNNRIPAIVENSLVLIFATGSRISSSCFGKWVASVRWPVRTIISVSMRQRSPYAIDRYAKETNRLYGVLNKRLADREFVTGKYSIADMAAYPWTVPHERQGQKLEDFPHLKRWFESIKARPAVVRAYEKAKEINTQPTVSEESKRILFGQTAAAIGR